MSRESDLIDEARSYASNHWKVALPIHTLDAARTVIEGCYEGGWSAFCESYDRINRSVAVKSEAWSPIKVRATVAGLLNRRLGRYDEIASFDYTPNKVSFVVNKATVTYGDRRDKVTSRELQLHVFTRTEAGWKHETVSVDDNTVSETVHFGAINTPERAAAQREQFETCYRPGTANSPSQGWVARLEISHKQAHENEVFQSTKKS